MSDKNVILSISLLTSNRLETIPRCLDSLKPILEAIPSELIIVDTSNNPEVYECDLKYTDKVEKFEWCNDFSKARNVGVKKAKGEWFMFIDDDEWLMDSTAIIDFFASGEYKNYGFAYLPIRNYREKDFKEYKDEWVLRLVKMHEDTMFRSKVHEYIGPHPGDGKQLQAMIGHSGYIYETPEEQQVHFERNVSLLKKMEEEEPDNLRWRIHLIQEYRAIQDWKMLEEYSRSVIEYIHKNRETCIQIELMQVYISYFNALYVNDKFEELKTFYERHYKKAEGSLLAKAYLHFFMGLTCYRLEEYALCERHMSEYLEGYEAAQKNPQERKKEEVQIIINRAFTESNYRSAQTLLLLTKLYLHKYDEIREVYEKMDWKAEEQKLFYNVHIKLIEALISIKDDDMLKTFLRDSLAAKHLKKQIIDCIVNWQKKDVLSFEKLVAIVKEIDIWNWYKLYIELISKCTSFEEVKEIGTRFVRETPNVFQVPDLVDKTFENKGVEIEDFYKELDFMTWKNQLAEHFSCINMQQLDELKLRLDNSSLNEDVRFAYFMMLYAEQKLLHTIEQERDFEFYNEWLYAFSNYTCKTYETLYAEEIPNMELEQLPHNYQAALWLKVYFEEVEKDIKTALPCLSKVIEVYPMFSDVVRSYLKCIQSEMLI